MAKTPKPWFRNDRKSWYVCINGVQYNLGRDKKAAFQEYYRLMRQPVEHKQVSGQSLVFVIDKFLDWVHINRVLDTYIWYRDLLQKFDDSVEAGGSRHSPRARSWLDGVKRFFENMGT